MKWSTRRTRVGVVTALAAALVFCLAAPSTVSAQTLQPPFDSSYSITDLGGPPGVPSSLGGLTLKAETTDRLLIGGDANTDAGALYEVRLTRDSVSSHINGFAAEDATRFADAAYNDGGVTYGPGGVLFLTRWDTVAGGEGNKLGQTKPGSSITDRVIDLGPLGVAHSPGALMFVPPGQPGADSLKLASYPNGEWYDASVAPDGNGTYDVENVDEVAASTLGGGPEGFVYVNPGSPHFSSPSILVSEFDSGEVAAYEIDANGDPIVATRRTFIDGLTGAEGALIDPVTGDFLFSTFGGGDRVILVSGFATTPKLTVIKHVVNDNGGSAAAGAWTMHIKSGGADVLGSPFAGAESPGVTRAVPPGSYVVSESGGPGGYAASISGDCAADGTVTVQPGESQTCTITNDDVAPPPPTAEFTPVPDPVTTPDVFSDKLVGYWKLRGSDTSAVFQTTRHGLFQGQLPQPIWGWTPGYTARTFRPGGCYRQVGRLAWVIGFAGGGAWYRYRPNSNCRPAGVTTARWFLNGPNGLRQQYIVRSGGPGSPGRQVRLFWARTRPLLDLERPSDRPRVERLTVSFRTFAHHSHRVELRRGGRVIRARTVRNRDGQWTIRMDVALQRGARYEVVLRARRGSALVRQIRRFLVQRNFELAFGR
jgi:hypothetical protein